MADGHAHNTAYLSREITRAAASGGFGPIDWLAPLIDTGTFPMLSRELASGKLEDGTKQTLDCGLA